MSKGFKMILLALFVALNGAILASGRDVIVSGPDNQTKVFSIHQGTTVLELKFQVGRSFCVPVYNQILLTNGSELGDNEKISFYLNGHSSTVQMVEKSKDCRIKLKVMSTQDKVQEVGTIYAKHKDSFDILQAKIFFILGGLIAIQMSLHLDGKSYYIDGDFRLVDHFLEKEEEKEATLVVNKLTREIIYAVKVELAYGKRIHVSVPLVYTIEFVKMELEFLTNYPIEEQKLFSGDRELIDDEENIGEFSILNNPYLKLVSTYRLKRNISIKYQEDVNLILEVYADETIECIRSKIHDELNIPTGSQRLNTIGRPNEVILADGDRLNDYFGWGILVPEIKLTLDNRVMGVQIKMFKDSETYDVFVSVDATILDIKELAGRRNRVKKEKIRFFMNELELLNAMTLRDYGIAEKLYLKIVIDKDLIMLT